MDMSPYLPLWAHVMLQEIEARRRREGIPVPGRTWHGLCKLAKKLHVEETLPSPVTQAPPLAAKL
jgi:hypothetical protein